MSFYKFIILFLLFISTYSWGMNKVTRPRSTASLSSIFRPSNPFNNRSKIFLGTLWTFSGYNNEQKAPFTNPAPRRLFSYSKPQQTIWEHVKSYFKSTQQYHDELLDAFAAKTQGKECSFFANLSFEELVQKMRDANLLNSCLDHRTGVMGSTALDHAVF